MGWFRKSKPETEYTLKRTVFHENFTLGELYLGNHFLFYSCEDPPRDKKIAGITCIPKGRYEVVITMSNRFKKPLPLLLNVPNFEGVRIHSGNSAEDSSGCVLLGLTRTAVGVANSQAAMALFMKRLEAALKVGKVYVNIV